MPHEIIPIVDVTPQNSNDINLTVIYSPFDLSKKDSCLLGFIHGHTVADYLGNVRHDDWIVYLNGKALPSDGYHLYTPKPHDHIMMVAVAYGGGDGDDKTMLRTISMIAVTVVAAIAAPAAAGALFAEGAARTAATGLISAGIVAGGTALINQHLPIPDESSTDSEPSPTYGFGAPQTSSGEGYAVPIIYGRHWTGGTLIAQDVGLIPNTNDESLMMTLLLSDGEISAVKAVEINDQPIDSYEDAHYHVDLGQLDNLNTSLFSPQVKNNINVNRKMTTTWQPFTLPVGANSIEGIINFPRGLFALDKAKPAKRNDTTVEIECEYRKKGTLMWRRAFMAPAPLAWELGYSEVDNEKTVVDLEVKGTGRFSGEFNLYRTTNGTDWTLHRTVSLSGRDKSITKNIRLIEDDNSYAYRYELITKTGRIDVNHAFIEQYVNGTMTHTDNSADSLRRPFAVTLTRTHHTDVYEVRFRRTTEEYEEPDNAPTDSGVLISDETWITSLEAISASAVAHRNCAKVRIDMKATDQLNSAPNINIDVEGRLVNRYDRFGVVQSTAWSDNPAWIALDIMITYGKFNPDRINFSAFVDWASFCIQNQLTFNGVFDQTTTIWDALQKVLRAGLAQANPLGLKFSLIINQPRYPVMLFTSSNMVENSFGTAWLSNSNRYNAFEAEYYDRDHKNRRTMLKIIDPDVNDGNRAVRTNKVGLMGVDNITQAEKLLGIYRAINKYSVMTCAFEAYLDGLACTIGDVVRVQNDNVRWGKSWRAESAVTGNQVLCPLSQAEIDKYGNYLMVHYPLYTLSTQPLQSVDAMLDQVTVNVIEHWTHIHFVKVGDDHIRVQSKHVEDGKVWLILEHSNGLTTGQTVELVQGDGTFKTQIAAIDDDLLTLASPLPQPVVQDSVMTLGISETVAKDFIVTNIDGNGEFVRKIAGIEYNTSLFDLNNQFSYVPPVAEIDAIGTVTEPQVSEELYDAGVVIQSRVRISWQPSDKGSYSRAKVVVRTNSHDQTFVTEPGVNFVTVDQLSDGQLIHAKIYAIDALGRIGQEAVSVHYAVEGLSRKPSSVTDLTLQLGFSGVIIEWSPNPELDVVSYQVRVGSSWDSAAMLVERNDTTKAVLSINKSGIYTVMVKAIDSLGNMSEVATQGSIEIKGPASVSGFTVAQNNRLLMMAWDAHPDPDVRHFIIRAGAIFDNADFIAKVAGNTYSTDIDLIQDDTTFWITAVDHFGIESIVPSFSRLTFNALANYNVIKEVNLSPDWSGTRTNLTVNADKSLIGSSDETVFQYHHRVSNVVDQPVRLTLRDTAFTNDSSLTWDQLEVPWLAMGEQSWVPQGMGDTQFYSRWVSRQLPELPSTLIEAYECNDVVSTVNGVYGKNASYSVVFSDPKPVRGGTEAMGCTTGYITFPFHTNTGRDSQIYASVAMDEYIELQYKVGTKNHTFEVTRSVDNGYFIIIHNGVETHLARSKTQGGLANCLINVMAWLEDNQVHFLFSPAGEKTFVRLSDNTTGKNISQLKLTCTNPDTGYPCFYVNQVRQEAFVPFAADSIRTEYLHNYSRQVDYSHFQRYLAGYHTAAAFDLRYQINTQGEKGAGISTASVMIDMPDVNDSGTVNTLSTASVGVEFDRHFTVPPKVVGQIAGGTDKEPDYMQIQHHIYDVTTTGFRIACFNRTNSEKVVRTVVWHAAGY